MFQLQNGHIFVKYFFSEGFGAEEEKICPGRSNLFQQGTEKRKCKLNIYKLKQMYVNGLLPGFTIKNIQINSFECINCF